MKWLHRRRDPAPSTEGEAEALKALHRADERVAEAAQSNPEVTHVVHTLKRHGERNNFTEMIRKTLQGMEH